jgi:hypothetical protein
LIAEPGAVVAASDEPSWNRIRDEVSTLSLRELLEEGERWLAVERESAKPGSQNATLDQQQSLEELAERVADLERTGADPTDRDYNRAKERLVGYCTKQRKHHGGHPPPEKRFGRPLLPSSRVRQSKLLNVFSLSTSVFEKIRDDVSPLSLRELVHESQRWLALMRDMSPQGSEDALDEQEEHVQMLALQADQLERTGARDGNADYDWTKERLVAYCSRMRLRHGDPQRPTP